jgi:hypothetical protein
MTGPAWMPALHHTRYRAGMTNYDIVSLGRGMVEEQNCERSKA